MRSSEDGASGGGGRDGRVRVAAMDIGSNAMRFTAVERRRKGRLVQIDYYRAPVRLGHDAFRTGRLTEANLEAAVAALVEFRRRLDANEVERHRAVATSAVRDAANGDALMEGARREAGIEVEVIDGREEARLVWLAVPVRLRPPGRWLLVDLGGGSMQLSTGRGETLDRSRSYPMGTVRLLERIEDAAGSGSDPLGDALAGLEVELAGELEAEPDRQPGARPDSNRPVLLAAGGNIEELARLGRAPAGGSGERRLSLRRLRRTVAEVESLSYEQRMEELGLRPDRADVIVPAGRVYLRVAELAGVDEVVVPGVSVSDGLLLEQARG